MPLAINSQQAKVFDLLRGFSTERRKFHEWYHGAIQILNSTSPDKIAQAAHSIRELCDALPNRIAEIPEFKNPISAAKSLFGAKFLETKEQYYGKGWMGKIVNQPLGEVLCGFEKLFNQPPRTKRFGKALTATDPQADFLSKDWRKERDKTFEELYDFFQNVAHHNHLATENELKDKLELFESLLLNFLTPCTADQQKKLLELMAAPANSETFAKVSGLIKHKTANFTFFFDKLENPDWIPLLDQKGYFNNLPEPEPTDNGRLIYRHYLPLMVLTRLAKNAPQAVTEILVKLRLPDNPYVGDQVLQCMAKISDAACVRQLHPLIDQLSKNPTRSGWHWTEELLKSWMELKVFPEIFAIIKGYLNRAVDLASGQYRDESNAWLTKKIDEQFLEQLSLQYPFDVADLTFRALCKWADQERQKYKASEISNDAPFSDWLDDFKSSPASHRGIESTLARRLFLVSEQIYLQGDLIAIDKLDTKLRADSWQLFRRLRWQLYADFPTRNLERARAEVLQQIPFLNKIEYGHDYEFARLLISHVKQYGDAFLSPSEVEQFVNVVLKGPVHKDGTTVEDYKDVFCRKQLWPIASLLRGEQLATYRVLVPDDSKIKVESFKPFGSGGVSGGFVASKAPKEAENLGAMEEEPLWTFLNTWEPKTGYEYDSNGNLSGENVFELAVKFAELLEKQPHRFNPATNWWKNIKRQEILNWLLDRAADRITKKENDGQTQAVAPSEDNWLNWLGVAKWVMIQTWSRDSVARFLGKVLESNYPIPDAYFLEFPQLLRCLVEEEDSRLTANKNSFGDWFSTAINSIRGKAMEALLNLAMRQKNAGKEIEPWIFELIRQRLELPEESPAIFAMFGAKLRFAIHLFGDKLKESPNLLFPPDRISHQSAVLVAHFKYDQPWNMTIKTFPDLIDAALKTLEALRAEAKDDEEKQNHRDFGSRLGIHIACYYWSDSFSDEKNGEAALDRFFSVASNSTRAALISQIASIWEKHSEESPDEKIITKVMRLWERRFEQITKNIKCGGVSTADFDGELSEFTDWLNCECFPFEWRFTHAKQAIERLKKAPRSPYHLLKAISEFGIMPSRLNAMLEIFRALLKRQSDELRWSIQFKDVAPVISLGLANGNPTTKQLAEECRDLLLRIGFSDFLNLGKEDSK